MKITLITGATGGLGKAFARLYAKDGNSLLLSGTNAGKLADASGFAGGIPKYHGGRIPSEFDGQSGL